MSTGRFSVPMYGLVTKLANKTAHDAAIHVELKTPFGLRDLTNRDLSQAIEGSSATSITSVPLMQLTIT